MIIANYLMLSVLMSSVSIIYTNFVYGEFDGEFRNNLTFGIGFQVFGLSWLSFYLVDTRGNKLSMTSGAEREDDEMGGRMRRGDDTRHFICHFNGGQFNMAATRGHHTNHDDYLWKEFWMELSIKNNNLYYREHWNDETNLAMSNIFAGPSSQPGAFSGYPAPRNFKREEHKIFAWMGFVGPVIKHNKYDNKNGLIGCINSFRANYIHISEVLNGEHFSYPCDRHIHQNVCNRGKCRNKIIRRPISNCNILELNTNEYCWKDLSIQTQQIHSYRVIKRNRKSTMIKLAWKQQQLRNNCLIEILGRNGFTTLFRTNNNDKVVMCHGKDRSMNCDREILKNLRINTIYVLLIEWSGTDMTVKISKDEGMNIFIDGISGYPYMINIGFSAHSDSCDIFHGALAFRYDTSHLKQLKSRIHSTISPINTSQLKQLRSRIHPITTTNNTTTELCNEPTVVLIYKIYAWQIILPWTLFLFSMMLVCIICYSVITHRRIREASRPKSNIYEEQQNERIFLN